MTTLVPFTQAIAGIRDGSVQRNPCPLNYGNSIYSVIRCNPHVPYLSFRNPVSSWTGNFQRGMLYVCDLPYHLFIPVVTSYQRKHEMGFIYFGII